MTSLQVEKPGFLTSVQDAGRRRCAHLGISASGAADALALRVGNLLVGNDADAPALEMALVGGAFRFEGEVTAALTGANFGATLAGRPVPGWTALRVPGGAVLEFGAARNGARAYLCVGGGFDVPPFLGSASTHLLTGLGGLRGRALRAGDVLPVGEAKRASPPARAALADSSWLQALYGDGPIRVTVGPQHDWFTANARAQLGTASYTVLEQSNRMGIRLSGPSLERRVADELLTEGVTLGAIQVPESGQPIILFVEHQTTGGYPKIANVCSVDLHRIGQLRARDTVRFEFVTLEEAERLLLEREAALRRWSEVDAS